MIHLKLLIFIGLIVGYKSEDQFSKGIWNSKRNSEYDENICRSQFSFLLSSITKEEWAQKVIDSWGKIPSGLLSGNIVSLGDFEECVGINEVSNTPENSFKSQYCLAGLNVSTLASLNPPFQMKFPQIVPFTFEITNNNARMMADSSGNIAPRLGICVPNTCSPSAMTDFINNMINMPLMIVDESSCQQQEEIAYSGLTIFGICLFSLFGLAMVLSTIYDVVQLYRKGTRNPNLIAFSMYTNGEKIFKCSPSKSPDVMDCLNGIRALSIVWVVYGHSYMMQALIPNINLVSMLSWPQTLYSMLILCATVSVDSFFLLSGLLVAWSVFRQLDKSNGRLNIFMMYLHRYIRLTPSLAAAILFVVSFSEYLINGPLKPYLAELNGECNTYWWSTLLYVQNYVNESDFCLGHSWYLSVDTQLFVLSPLILYPLWRWGNKFVWVVPLLTALSMACTFTIFMLNDYSALFLDPNTEGKQEKTYYVTHTRYGPYMVGILLAYILFNLRGKSINLPKIVVIVGWIISLGSILAILFGLYPSYRDSRIATPLEGAFYEPFSRVGWAICLSWIIFACVHGYGGPINWFLSLPQWQPICRLSYSIYIIHLPIQIFLAATKRTSSYFSDISAIHSFWGDFGLTLTVAIFWSMAFESPILTLEKLLFNKEKSTSQSQENLLNKDRIERNGQTV